MKQLNYTLLTIMLVAFGMVGMNAQDITHADGNFTVTQGTTVNYYDNGGPDCDNGLNSPGEYIANSDATAVICPDVAGSVITIEFLDVDVEIRTTSPCWDFINIYDGDNTGATQLFSGCGEEGFASCAGFPGDGGDGGGVEGGVNDIDGSNAPSPVNNVFTSTAANGCLTVNFTSDSSVPEGGWVAEVTASAVGGGGATCNDGIQNGDETGVDCGGSCAPCGGGGPTCMDGIQNGDETGVDCGGASCPPCVVDPPSCEEFTLNIDFDNFSSETSWEIVDLGGNVVESNSYGGGLDETEETYCLDPGCYTFDISDSFGDGICCGFGIGSYTLEDADENVVASGGDYGSGESTLFCTAPPADCVPPTATATVVSYCGSGVYMVLVTLSDLGSASTVVISNNGGQPALENVFFPRTYYVGPFDIGRPVDIFIYDPASSACNVIITGLADNCGGSIAPGGGSDVTSFGIFPNPTTGEINLNVAQYVGKNAEVSIYNAMGQLIEQRQLRDIQTATERFDLSAQQSGMYMISLNVDGTVYTERVMLNSVRP